MVAKIPSQHDKGALRRRWALSTAVMLFLSAFLGLVVAALSRFALLTLSLARPEVDARAAVAEALASFLGNIPLIGNALSELAGNLDLARWLEPNLGSAALVIGFLIGLATLWSRSCKVTAHLFLPMDRSIALPLVPPSRALEPLRPMLLDDPGGRPMSWVEPREGPRKEVWLGLADFALGQGGKFEYQLLLGGPGSGKTRMSIEFARRILAKKGEVDDASMVLHGSDNHDMLMTREQRLRSWWRIRVLGRDPRPDDIWHVGWFSPEALSTSNGRLMIKGQLASNLDLWRPTRPTLLLLDDPLHEDSVFVVESLNKNAASFRHRVRLLIANQTVPGDLHFSRAHLDKAWQSQVHPPFADPLMLSAAAPLSDGEIRLLAGQLPTKLAQPILTDSGLRDFRTVTRGNPLLVELGLSWLGSGKPLLQMTEERLLEDRTRRFLQAIKTAGFEAGQGQLVDLLTMATIASGAPTTLPDGSEGETVWSVFGVQRIDQQNAARLFPAEADIDLRSYLPPMRPETIATAFARMAIVDLPLVDRNRIIRTAWRANPRGTLRTLLRIDGGYKFRTDQEDPLQSAFAAVPMQSGLAPIEVFRLLAQASCSASLQDWEDGKYHLGTNLLENAIAEVQVLIGDDLPLAFAFVVDLILADRSTRMLRETNAARLLVEVLRANDRAGRLFDAPVLNNLIRWAASPRAKSHKYLHGWESDRKKLETSVCCLEPNLDTLVDVVVMHGDKHIRQLFSGFIEAFLKGETPSKLKHRREFLDQLVHYEKHGFDGSHAEIDAAREKCIRLLSSTGTSLTEMIALCTVISRALIDLDEQEHSSAQLFLVSIHPLLEELISNVGLTPVSLRFFSSYRSNFALIAGKALPRDGQRSAAHELAKGFETIGEAIFDDAEVHSKISMMWKCAAKSYRSDIKACITMADQVEAIGERFPVDERIQLERATAWGIVCHATTSDPVLCRQMAERVEAISGPFPDHEMIQEQRAAAWSTVTHTTLSAPALCRLMAERVAEIAGPFASHEGIQVNLASAWRYVTYATMSDPNLCRQMAERVEAIAQHFANHEGIQANLASAWCYVTYATMSDPSLCRQMAERVKSIARSFPNHDGIQEEARLAVSYLRADSK